MPVKRDYYEVLGVGRGANEDEIRKAFRRLARQYHPDVNRHDGAEARFKEINEAYEVLSDPEKRRNYDQFGHAGRPSFETGSGGFGFGFDDIFESFFNMGGTATRRQQQQQRGADLQYNLRLKFEEAIFGCEKELEIPRLDTCTQCAGSGAEPGSQPMRCPQCNGSGELRRLQQSLFGQLINVVMCDRCRGQGQIVTTPCHKCGGQGRVQTVRRLPVTIPAGVEDGNQMRLTGEGEAGPRGGRSGNLFVALSVDDHAAFKRQGDDLVYQLPINIAQATLGDEVNIPTLEGEEIKLRITPGTQPGKTLRVRDRGVPHMRGTGRGDLLVHVQMTVPTHLSDEQRALLHQLAKSFGTPIQPDGRNFINKVKDVFKGE